MLNHSVPAGRGEVGLMPCPQCGDHHRSVYRLSGMAVLQCPTLTTPGEMRMRQVVKGARGGLEFVLLVGPEADIPPVVIEKLAAIPAIESKRRTA